MFMSAKEIADKSIDGLPSTERGMRMWLQKHNIPNRQRMGQGGGQEFDIDKMPMKYRLTLVNANVKHGGGIIKGGCDKAMGSTLIAEKPRRTPLDTNIQNANIANKKLLQTRLDLLNCIENYAQQHGQAWKVAAEEILNARELAGIAFNAGGNRLSPMQSPRAPNPSIPTLLRWRKWRSNNDLQSLSGGNWGNRADSGKIAPDGEIEKILIGLIASNPHLTNRHLRDVLEGMIYSIKGGAVSLHGDEDEAHHLATAPLNNPPAVPNNNNNIPSERSIARWREAWLQENKRGYLYATNPDDYQNKYRPAHGNAYEWVKRPNQLWETDASPADILTIKGRYYLYSIIDIYTRRMIVHVCKNPSTAEFLKLFRKAHSAWGKPETIRTDNGKDFTSNWFRTAFEACGIRQHTTKPYAGWEKGSVESHFRTIQHDLMPTLPGFIGHNVGMREQIRSMNSFAKRRGLSEQAKFAADLTPETLQTLCDAWCENRHFHRKHGGLQNKSPAEQLALSTHQADFIADDMLNLFLAPPASGKPYRVIGKKGVALENANFTHPLMASLIGKRVFVRLDEDDLGMVHIFHEDGLKFLFTAENSRRKGEGRKLVASQFAQEMAQQIDQAKQDIMKAKRPMRGADISRIVHGDVSNLHILNRNNMGGATNNNGDEAKARENNNDEQVVKLPETAGHRWQKAKGLWQMMEAGQSIDPLDIKWLREYQATPECKKREERERLLTNECGGNRLAAMQSPAPKTTNGDALNISKGIAIGED